MKNILRKVFQPILGFFESGEGDYNYKPSHRTILLVVGILFLILATVSAISAITASQMAGIIPILIFLLVGLVCGVVGLLGSNRAVAKIWGS